MKILVAYDGSSHSDRALERGADIANKFAAELLVLAVTPDIYLPSTELSVEASAAVANSFEKEAQKFMEPVANCLASMQISTRMLIEKGDPAEVILKTAEATGTDLIVLGSRGRHGAKRLLLGSVSGTVSEYSKCNVLIVK